MSKKPVIPDAWDDDWEIQADDSPKKVKEITLTKAERQAQHIEANKKIWKSAEEPEQYLFLTTQDNTPLKSEFKPALKVLSRKPTPVMVEQIDPATGFIRLKPVDTEDHEEERNTITPEQQRLKAIRELEEKQKRYDVARARILGVKSGSSSPGDTTTYMSTNPEGSRSSQSSGKGKRSGRDTRQNDSGQHATLTRPDIVTRKKNLEISRSSSRDDSGIIRIPRGPDQTGKPGFQFFKKGAR
ncbi:hypothetical protein OnM2_039025 [Erysiphe neolycopersici]|uniref:SUZ-C domain-containing protein n=1 Tax=Erysiphe neolycopersici TaxID=212602 RepID=A0A420HWH0_9PEZI|nr:hypothetical protein OnM2_039025 [Erysiphe neolycopersici]